MAHPHKSSAANAHTAKMRKMTKDYGSASGPANNMTSPQSRLKQEGPEEDVGFGADSSKASARSDRPARRSAAANPVATYATGGVVGKSTGGVIARARGGRAKGATSVNIVIAPQSGQPQGAPGLGNGTMSPQLAALAGPPPGAPPMGAPPMAPGAGAPPPMPQGAPPMMRAKGGRVGGDMTDDQGDEVSSDALIQRVLDDEGLIRRARGGGITMTAGAATGVGRLEKMGIKARHRGSMAPKEV